MKRRDLGSALLLAIAVAVGAARELRFVNLNYHLYIQEHVRDRNYAHSLVQAWTVGCDAGGVRLAKWSLAILCILLMLGLTVFLARIRFSDHRYRRPLVLGFAFIASLALACHGLGHAWPALGPISIKLLHALQYPVPMLFVWVLSLGAPR